MIDRMPEIRPYPMEAFDNRIERGTRRFSHIHGGNELFFICELGTTVIHAGVEVPAPVGSLFLHRADEVHGVVSDGTPTRTLVINYEPDEEFEACFPTLSAHAPRRWHLGKQQAAAYIDFFTRLQAEIDGQRPGWIEASSAWIRLLLVSVSRSDEKAAMPTSASVDADIHQLRRAIDLRRQGSANGALGDMVDNYDALRHRFRRTYGESPSHMLSRLRIEKSKSLLRGSDLSMAEIAQQVGYIRQHEFSRAFHRVVGCTPTAFRRQAKQGG